MRFFNFVLIGLIGAILHACATYSNDSLSAYKGQSALQIYQTAKGLFINHHYSRAIKVYEALDAIYPFSPYAERAELELIYSYYQEGESPSAKAMAERFIHVYPRSTFIDYAYYMQALADMDQDRGWYLRYVPIDLSRRNPGSMRLSYQEFMQFIYRYPESRYAADARQRMVYLRDLFADYDLHIANYYFRKKAFVAAANRANEIVKRYQGTPDIEKALIIMVRSYRKLGLEDLANQSLAVLILNYPQSDFLHR